MRALALALVMLVMGTVVPAQAIACLVIKSGVVINITQYPTDITGQVPPDYPGAIAQCASGPLPNNAVVGAVLSGNVFTPPTSTPIIVKGTAAQLIDALAAQGIITALQATTLHTAIGQ